MSLNPRTNRDTTLRHKLLHAIAWVLLFAFCNVQIVQAGWLQKAMTAEDQRHLLSRTGFGVTLAQLEMLQRLSRKEAIDVIIQGVDTSTAFAMPSWVEAPAPRFWTRAAMSGTDRQQFDRSRDREMDELRQWWVSTMLQTSSPQTERLVLFWHDHFATSYEGVNRHSISMARQNQTFREHALGSYRDLLKAMIRDPALLQYLNNPSNRKGSANENLAREFLELFTLGEGNYSEQTVKEAARALTGYGFSATHNMSFQLNGNKHDPSNKTLFGIKAKHDGETLVDAVLKQDAAAVHLATKFWHAFISDSPVPSRWLNNIAAQFRESDYQLEVLYRSVLESEAFWDESNRLAIVKSPASLLIGTARALDFPKQRWQQLPSLHALLGMNLFAPPNVSGWAEGGAFVIPGRLLNRQHALQTLLSLNQFEFAAGNMMVGQTMSNAGMQAVATMDTSGNMPADKKVPLAALSSELKIRLAAEHFEGPAQYQISIYKQNELLWTSKEAFMHVGLDTEYFGRMASRSMLPWQLITLNIPTPLLKDTTAVEISFLNDNAGDRGDRNLYIDGVSINEHWYSASTGQQSSACVPKGRMDAGNLYCQGHVRIPIVQVQSPTANTAQKNESVSASNVLPLWSRAKKNKLYAELALENVEFAHQRFHTLSISLVSKSAAHLDLRLNNYSCWPDCLQTWPECAWQDGTRANLKTISIPLLGVKHDKSVCHFDQLSDADKILVSTLAGNARSILQLASNNAFRERDVIALKRWLAFFDEHKAALSQNRYASRAKLLSFTKKQNAVQPIVSKLHAPTISYENLSSFEQALTTQKLNLADVLMSGTNASVFPSLNTLSKLSIEQQLKRLIEHPAFQVH